MQYLLFDELKTLKHYTRSEALAIARLHRNNNIHDSVHYIESDKKGKFTISQLGIIESDLQFIK